jgi:membrane protease YdiL (CAAX protease family)
MSNASSKAPDTRAKRRLRLFQRVKTNGLGHPLRVVINALLIFFVSQILAAFIVQISLNLVRPRQVNFIGDSVTAQFFYVLIAEALAVGFVFYILRLRSLDLSVIGLGRRPQFRDIKRAAAGFLVFYVILIAAGAILSLFFPDINKGTQDVGFNDLHGTADTLVALFALVILPPLGEEPLVRGYLYSGLRQRLRFVPAVIITSVLFGLAHLQTGVDPGLLWAAGMNTFILSVVLCYLRETSGALYAGMLVHGTNNLIAFGIHFHAHFF